MEFTIETEVPGFYTEVMAAFDKDLFEALKPVGAKLEIVRFTGSETGDIVHLKFISPFKAEWISHITEHGSNNDEAYFVDEGITLPTPLIFWRHRHVVKNAGSNKSIISDQIEYKTSSLILDAIIRPFVYMGFYPRKKQYKKYFS